MSKQMTKVLVLGGRGLLGHAVYSYLTKSSQLQVRATHHQPIKGWFKFDGRQPEPDLKAIFKLEPYDWVVNVIGLLQHDPSATVAAYEEINADLPQKLAKLTQSLNYRLIHISTDAVFAPDAGPVMEAAKPNPVDQYSQSKLAGEVTEKNCLTIRTSVIGMDPFHHRGLLEWALTQTEIGGFINQTWSGATNLQLAQFILAAIKTEMTGLIHFAPLGPVSKFELLNRWVKLWPEKMIRVNAGQGTPVDRYLITKYPSIHQAYQHDITQALKAIIKFEPEAYG
ncbi:hypothetical protein A2W24_05555 [Microgenomates group bacterium RBG_16_45_19]|nr:MAG: hypothetical protein A2W24_05555 [Microgenomates group bacterium RBG_16_45_19]